MGFQAGDEGVPGSGTTGIPFTFAGFDALGAITSVPGWFYVDQPLQWVSAQVVGTPQATITDFQFITNQILLDTLALNNYQGFTLQSLIGSIGAITITNMQAFKSSNTYDVNLDVTNSQSFVDSTAMLAGPIVSGYVSFWSALTINRDVTNYYGFISQTNFGNTSLTNVQNLTEFGSFSVFQANAVIVNYQGFNLSPTFFTGSDLDNYTAFRNGPQIDVAALNSLRGIELGGIFGSISATTINNIIDLQIQTNFGAFSTLTSGYSGINVGPTFVAGGSSGGALQMIQSNPTVNYAVVSQMNQIAINSQLGNLSAVAMNSLTTINVSEGFGANLTLTDYFGLLMRINPAIGASITNNYTGISVGINSALPISGTAYGIQVDLSNAQTTSKKIGVDVNNGALTVQSNIDTSVFTPTPFDNSNSLSGTFTVASGDPLLASPWFANYLGHQLIFDDDVTADLFLGASSLGFSLNGFANQIAVAATKTVDTLNYMLAAGSFPALSTGGTITNLSMFRAGGLINAGGTLVITNEILFHGDAVADLGTPTNLWGLRIDATLAENYLEKSLAIGTVTKKVSAANVGLEILIKDIVLDQGAMWFYDPSASGFKTVMSAATLVADTSFILPPDDGVAGYVLQTDGAGNTSWQPGSSASYTRTAVDSTMSPYTVLASDDILIIDASGGPVVIDLLQANTAPIKPLLITIDIAGNPVTLNAFAGDTILGQNSQMMIAQYTSVQLWSNGSLNWFIN